VIMTLGEDIVIVKSESEKYFKEEIKSCLKRNKNEHNSNSLRDRRKKKKRSSKPVIGVSFADLYKLTGETLGEGSYGIVETCKNVFTGIEYAVKIIEKRPGSFNRSKVLKEIEIYHLCRGQRNIIQMIEFFEEADNFYLVFEKINGGPLLKHIQKRLCFTEAEASLIIKDLAEAIRHLHRQGIAHRDIKPDNVLCVNSNSPFPVKLCDFDLCSSVSIEVSTPQLLSPVGSLEYMAPEVVEAFMVDDYDDDEEEISYNKKCDLWSLGIIMYILFCGYAPFSGNCGLDCGWERGDSCTDCQEMLFASIKEGEVNFSGDHWSNISPQAKHLIQHLLVRDSSSRLDAEQVLDHPWIVNCGSSNILQTPSNLKRQLSINDLEDFASRAMAVNRAVEEDDNAKDAAITIPHFQLNIGSMSFDRSPSDHFSLNHLQRRRRSKELFSKFSSIDELDSDYFMKTIY
jgi:MAP kinase interacting serine/threonine kinase